LFLLFIYFLFKENFFHRNLSLPINLQLYRRNIPPTIDKIVLNSVDQHQPLKSEHNYSFSDTYANRAFCSSDKQYDLTFISSDESESGVGSESTDGENRLVCFCSPKFVFFSKHFFFLGNL